MTVMDAIGHGRRGVTPRAREARAGRPEVVVVAPGADPSAVRRALIGRGLWVRSVADGVRTHILLDPPSAAVDREGLLAIDGVAAVLCRDSATPLVDAQPSVVHVGDLAVGPGAPPVVAAGPCSVESEEAIDRVAERLSAAGVSLLRGGAFKPRTSPYSFQGHGRPALRWMAAAARRHGLKVVTEAMAPEEVGPVAEHADVLQIGSRNMHAYALLRAAGAARMPVLLKRGMAATVEEWLAAGEYLLLHGASAVVFCERGIRGFDPSTRNVLDLGAVALLAGVHRVPVIVDPSHAAGRRDLIPALAHAALAAGASGVMIETHDAPGDAASDGPQALPPDQLAELLAALPIHAPAAAPEEDRR